jgi:thiol:disulfide interchange protein DsbD
MKKLLIFFLLIFAFAKPLSIDEAFKPSFIPQKNGVEFELKMGKGVHIYKNKFKVFVNDKLVKLNLPKAQKDMFGDEAYFNEFKIFIPAKNSEIKVEYEGCGATVCYAPQTKIYHFKTSQKSESKEDKITNLLKDASLFKILVSFFVFGVLLSLTPCIFPMIPILSGLLVKTAHKNSFLVSVVYVLSMSITYTIAGVLAGIFGANIQALFQNPYIIIAFSLVFVLLALSMFGFFEIGLPASIQTKLTKTSDKAGKKGGLLGVAIMGFLSALIVGPCVAPPLAGALIYISHTGNALLGGVALFIMSIGMGIPLLIMGLGANKLIPKAGTWMLMVNKIFGVIMLGVAIWFLDRILPVNVISILWAILLIGVGLYLNPFTKIENYKDTILKTIAFILLVVGSSLIFKVINSSEHTQIEKKELWEKVNSLSELEKIVKNNQRVIVDFTAKWCVACKEYDATTFKDRKILDEFKNYKLIQIDITNPKEKITKRFEISGPPTILIFENGELKQKIVGYRKKDEFLKILER